MKGGMLKKTVALMALLSVVLFVVGGAGGVLAAEEIDLGIQKVRLSDRELNQVRGGDGGVHFGLRFSGYVDNVGQVDGAVVSGGAESPSVSPGGETSQLGLGNGAAIQAYVGNFDGASGIFQIVQSPGSYNVIHNNLIVEITVINVMDQSAIPSLENFLQ